MDQGRRRFIKQISLTALWAAYATANPKVVEALTEVLSPESPLYTGKEKILIYKIHNWIHGSQICASKYQDQEIRLKRSNFDLETFEPIEIVDVDLARDRKKYWWDNLNCQGRYVPYDLKTMAEAGQKGHKTRKAMGISTISKGPTGLEKFDPEYRQDIKNLWNKVHPETWPRAIEYLKTYWIKPKNENQKESARSMGKKHGGKCGGKNLIKNFTKEQISEQRRKSGSYTAQLLLSEGRHNLSGNSNPQKRKFLCPDGKITAYAQAVAWCKKRGLDFAKARELTKEEYALMYESKVQTRIYHRSDGTTHGRIKLTDDEIRAIKYEYSHLTTRAAAKMFNVGSSTIGKIRRGETHSNY